MGRSGWWAAMECAMRGWDLLILLWVLNIPAGLYSKKVGVPEKMWKCLQNGLWSIKNAGTWCEEPQRGCGKDNIVDTILSSTSGPHIHVSCAHVHTHDL